MGSGRIFNIRDAVWTRVRPELTNGIKGTPLIPANTAGITVTATKVEAGGRFSPHRDPYSHVLYFLSGRGEVSVEGSEHSVTAGNVVRIAAGETHSYRNSGDEEMTLLTINIP